MGKTLQALENLECIKLYKYIREYEASYSFAEGPMYYTEAYILQAGSAYKYMDSSTVHEASYKTWTEGPMY